MTRLDLHAIRTTLRREGSALAARLLPSRARAALRGRADTAPGPERAPAFDPRPAPMPPLRPPAATNDNPLRGVHEEVERALRAGGYLR